MSPARVRIEKRRDENTIRDYDIGYCRPPKSGQFKPGQSGNPRGRPRGTKNLKTDLVDELRELVVITENGRTKKLSKQKLILKAMTAKAIKGDPRAADLVIRLVAQTLGFDPSDNTQQALADDDVALLADFMTHVGAESAEGK